MSINHRKITDSTLFWIGILGFVTVLVCSKILFTDQIIRASDVVSQYFWGARSYRDQSLFSYFSGFPNYFRAEWGMLLDGGRTLEGGWNANGLLFYERLIYKWFPFPSSIAWLAVLSLLWGGIGTFCYCRVIGMSRFGALSAGILFALCTENSSLINAGHIQKIETIIWFPWALMYLEKALQGGRVYHYAMTSLMLAIQFFNMHWQIAFYSCLAIAFYWIFYVAERFITEKSAYAGVFFRKDLLRGTIILVMFFTTIAMSFAPLLSWSKQSERSGGMSYDEGMSWSMPPEEIATFIAPGLFGLSRQEAGDKPKPGQVYYWGRMHMTQTNDYLGLLPWLFLPLPLFFRRDRATLFFAFLMAITLTMALGKYSFVYRFMFEHLPGFSTFRVPKMVLFLFAFGAAVLMGRGLDCCREMGAERKGLRGWIFYVSAFTVLSGLLYGWLATSSGTVMAMVSDFITQSTRYQSNPGLVQERYFNMVREAGIGFAFAAAYAVLCLAWFKKWKGWKYVLPALLVLLLFDLWRVNDSFLVLGNPPEGEKQKSKNEVVGFLEKRIGTYRMQPINDESSHYYAEYGFGNISAYVTVSEKRYKDFLETFSLMSRMPDMMNLKYLVMPMDEYRTQQAELDRKYFPVFTSSKGAVVLENRTVLPKAWLVPEAIVINDLQQRVTTLSHPMFDPSRLALLESPPLVPLAAPGSTVMAPGDARVDTYEANRIIVSASTGQNALLVLGEKYYNWWYAYVDGKKTPIVPVNHILRGVYLTPGTHKIEFRFDPLPFKIGKYLTLGSFVVFAVMLIREGFSRRKKVKGEG